MLKWRVADQRRSLPLKVSLTFGPIRLSPGLQGPQVKSQDWNAHMATNDIADACEDAEVDGAEPVSATGSESDTKGPMSPRDAEESPL